jgi:hypothetical protein
MVCEGGYIKGDGCSKPSRKVFHKMYGQDVEGYPELGEEGEELGEKGGITGFLAAPKKSPCFFLRRFVGQFTTVEHGVCQTRSMQFAGLPCWHH